jgi:hypothetical protein
MPLNIRLRQVDPRTLKLLDVNARFFPKETYDTLVRNVKRDGALTSVPLVYPADADLVLSGNHRVMAAVEANLPTITVMDVLDEQSRDELIARQLSHNAIVGQDDPATLKALYDQIEDVDWRDYSGLDDKALDLMTDADLSSLSEANLDFAVVQLVFLPAELDRAREALDNAHAMITADERWLARFGDYEKTLDALQSAHLAWRVGNVATAFGGILDVFEAHLTDLAAGFLDGTGEPARDGPAPLEAVLGTRVIPTDAAAVLNRAIEKMIRAGDVPADNRVRALELLAANYLAEPDMGV